jgi:sugar/nucleoside kinase (ribokinase family)
MPDIKICCVGAVNLDKILTFKESPELGRDTSATTQTSVGGVACNVAQLLKKFGAGVAFVGVIGADLAGEFILKNLRSAGLDVEGIQQLEGANTVTYTALHRPDGELHIAAIDCDIYDTAFMDPLILLTMLQKAEHFQHWVVDSCFPSNAYQALLNVITAKNISLHVVISSINNIDQIRILLPHTKMLFGNVAEILYLAGIKRNTRDDILQALTKLREIGIETIFATDGANGVYAKHCDNNYYVEAVPVTKVISVNGAGDTFAAATLYNLLQGIEISAAMTIGVRAAAARIAGLPVVANAELTASFEHNIGTGHRMSFV